MIGWRFALLGGGMGTRQPQDLEGRFQEEHKEPKASVDPIFHSLITFGKQKQIYIFPLQWNLEAFGGRAGRKK